MATTLRSLLLTATGSIAVLGAVLTMRTTSAIGGLAPAGGAGLETRGAPAADQSAFGRLLDSLGDAAGNRPRPDVSPGDAGADCPGAVPAPTAVVMRFPVPAPTPVVMRFPVAAADPSAPVKGAGGPGSTPPSTGPSPDGPVDGCARPPA
ncbi:hypothetical protein [Streptosporangium sp. NPDC000396]|uniref:hypothetical protein n=1 Tax=Streptosporangium sp. NPDC000396 TaxID=3366185 RepID=UPI0036B22402